MSLILSSPVAPQATAAAATSQAGRSDSQIQNDSDSFGAVLERSQAGTGTAPGKAAARRLPRDQGSSGKTEQPDPAAALALALIALEPRLATAPASAAPSGPASTVAAALETDTGLSAAQGALPTLSQSDPEQLVPQLALATPKHGMAGTPPKEQPALAAPDQPDGDSPVLSANAATIDNAGATAETLPRLSTPQIALAAAGRHEAAPTALPAKDTATDAGAAVTREAGKIADQVMTPDTRSSGQQSKQGAATDDRDGKFSVKPELQPADAPAAASVANAAEATKGSTVAADQLDSGTAAPVGPTNVLPQPPVVAAQQAAAAPASLPLTPPVGSSEWGDALGKQMVWMGNANHQVAELQLNPAGLGPLKVTLTINNHQAEALFVSAHPSVRAAVEAALPQLRTNLADNGISLGNTSVSADTQQQGAFAQDQANQSGQHRYRTESMRMPNPVADSGLPAAAATIADNHNKVDTFA